MSAIMSVILMLVLSVASATAGIRLYCDYQGNVRQVVDAQGNVLEQNDYYPYGGLFGESASHQNYKYSGKEMERMNGLNTYDFHARPYYYPALQFHSPDLLSEKNYHVSPYLYCLGNPIKYTVPTGMDIYNINTDGTITIQHTNDKFNQYYLITKVDNSITSVLIGQFDKNQYNLIQMSDFSFEYNDISFSFAVKDGNESQSYISGDAMASFLGAMIETGYQDVTIIGVSNENGSSPAPSKSHINGKNMDLRYLRTDYSSQPALLGTSTLDIKRQNILNDALYKYGWKDLISEKFIPWGEKAPILLNHTRHYSKSRHHNHLHIQGYRPKIIKL